MVNEVPVPVPRQNEFLVRIRSASLCHTDVEATLQIEKTVTLGHEGVGYVVSMHPSAADKGFQLGNAVGFLHIRGSCFECRGCQVHNRHCERGKPAIQGIDVDGFFAEYAIVDYRNAVILDESKWDMDVAPAFFCAGISAFYSVDSCELTPGDWFGVLGCGGLGQLATQYAKAMGLKVVGIDLVEGCLQEARKQGADAVFNSRWNADWAQDVKKLTGGGVQAVGVYTDAPAAFSSAPTCLSLGGTLMVVGNSEEPLKVHTTDLLFRGYKIKAASTGTPQRMKKAVDFTAEHGIMPVVQLRNGLDDLGVMVQEMVSGKVTKRQGIAFKWRVNRAKRKRSM